jgi:WD40 repeat protein
MPAIRTIRKIISHDPDHFVFARSACWSPDGNRILIGNNNGEICIQDWKLHENTVHEPVHKLLLVYYLLLNNIQQHLIYNLRSLCFIIILYIILYVKK